MARASGRLIGHAFKNTTTSGIDTTGVDTIITATDVVVGNHDVLAVVHMQGLSVSSASAIFVCYVYRDETATDGSVVLGAGAVASCLYPATISYIDTPGAGTYDYSLRAGNTITGTAAIGACRLMVFAV